MADGFAGLFLLHDFPGDKSWRTTALRDTMAHHDAWFFHGGPSTRGLSGQSSEVETPPIS